MQHYATPQLTLDQAYQAAFLWLDHIGQPPTSISEPANGVIELRSDELVGRLRWSRTPINQAAVLAMLRQSDTSVKRVLFSVTGYTPGAVSLADTQGVALMSFDSTGRAQPQNAHGIALSPGDTAPVPFPPQSDIHEELPVVTAPPEHMEYDLDEWIDCPRCGLTHHAKSNFCMSCGADLHGPPPPPEPKRRRKEDKAPAEAQPTATGPRLRCKTCGSDDIELIHPGYGGA
jgi:DNA-directed RNA polymerase subunit RPC12/RpoP